MAKMSAVVWPNGKAYFFKGSEYVRYDVAADRADDGYPQPISGGWAGVFAGGVDAAVVWPNGKAYFFKGSEYVRYDVAADKADDGYPQPISGGWAGVFAGGVDAAVVWPNGKAYFFKGSEYVRYDVAADRADDGYPQPISGGWAGVFAGGVDAAVVWPNGKAYFFKGSEYVRYDVAADRADDGYPQPISSGWPTLFPSGQPATPSGGGTKLQNVRAAFLTFSEPFEGRVYWMYLDVKGLVTTAVGNLIDPEAAALELPFVLKGDGSPASRAEISGEWQMLKAKPELAQQGHRPCEAITNLRLTDASIDALVLAKFDGHEKSLRQAFGDWDKWPADAQLGAHSLAWAGANFPAKWPKFKAAVAAHDWRAAATESHLDETGNPGVKPRNAANVQLFNNAAVVEANGLDGTTVQYPQRLS